MILSSIPLVMNTALRGDLVHVEYLCRRRSPHVWEVCLSAVFLTSIHVTQQGRNKSLHVCGYSRLSGYATAQQHRKKLNHAIQMVSLIRTRSSDTSDMVNPVTVVWFNEGRLMNNAGSRCITEAVFRPILMERGIKCWVAIPSVPNCQPLATLAGHSGAFCVSGQGTIEVQNAIDSQITQ